MSPLSVGVDGGCCDADGDVWFFCSHNRLLSPKGLFTSCSVLLTPGLPSVLDLLLSGELATISDIEMQMK